MLTFLTTLTLGLTPLPQGLPNAKVVINEFQYDDYAVAPDVREFVELYNRSNAPVDISGWTLTNQDVASSPVIYTVPASTILPVGGFWVMGSAVIPNVNQVLSLAPLRTELLWNENSSLTLRDTTNTIVDTVFYEANKGVFLTQLKEGEGLWGNFQSTAGVDSSWSRIRDGYDTNDNGRDFRTVFSTPGTTNNRTGNIPYFSFYDTKNIGDPCSEFGCSFKVPRVIDPTLTGTYNVNAIPVSPQGGLAMIMWDESGGGNSTMLLSDVATDWVFEAWVYFDSVPEVATEYETWSVGFGSTCSLYNTPDPSRTLYTTPSANGNTGVCWTFQNTSTSSVLYLVDHNNGGADHVVIGSIPLTHNVNDGWQRLRLEVHGNRVEGIFGGNIGKPDGTHVYGTLNPGALAGFYMGYREFIGNNATCRPFTADFMRVAAGRSALVDIGTAVATTKGTPALDASGFPMLGWGGFALNATGLVPSGTTAFVIGGTLLSTPIDLQLFGGQAGSKVYQTLDLVLTVPSNATGAASLPLPVPSSVSLLGGTLYSQNLDVDFALPTSLPLGNSKTLKITIGD